MVALPEGYCIDSTEVTRSQYQTWLAAGPATSGQIADCAANTSFTPDATCMAGPEVCQGSGCGDHPQTCVDWCDAYAFCRGVGKRLCGRIGGGSVDSNDHADPTLDQWFNACSSHGQFAFPYSSTYRGTACNGGDYWVPNYGNNTTLAVGSLTTCQSPSSSYAGVYDLSGNVWEWEDSCGAGGCFARGGSYTFYQPYLACGSIESVAVVTRTFCLAYVGFRCCS
jgi:formylglycine-generating enzyme required for sulfatase activity